MHDDDGVVDCLSLVPSTLGVVAIGDCVRASGWLSCKAPWGSMARHVLVGGFWCSALGVSSSILDCLVFYSFWLLNFRGICVSAKKVS